MWFSWLHKGVFGKQDSDTKEDFRDIYDFDDAFRRPFLPSKLPAEPEPQVEEPAAVPASEEQEQEQSAH